jgi:peptide/nickel transport system substrate-binding protein
VENIISKPKPPIKGIKYLDSKLIFRFITGLIRRPLMTKKLAIPLVLLSILSLLGSIPYAGAHSTGASIYLPIAMGEYPGTLKICLGTEPSTLYIYDGTTLAKSQILEAIYDGPIDNRSYGNQAVILEKIPSLSDGDAVIRSVPVNEGDKVVDFYSNVVTLSPGAFVILSGQTEPITYSGGEVRMDVLEVSFTLKSGLTWSDGAPLTANDSVYAFNLLLDPATTGLKFVVERTASYLATSDRSTKWTGLPGFKDPTYFLNYFGPAPQHVWGQYSAAELYSAEVSTKKPIGWGPYVIEEWVKGDHIRLSPNPNYFRSKEGLPKFSGLIYRFVGQNSDANLNDLLEGECHILDQTSGLDFGNLVDYENDGLVKISLSTGSVFEHVDFGIQHISYDDGYNSSTDRPDFFSDVRVRRAFAMCMDRQSINETIWQGRSTVIDTYVPPGHPLYNPTTAHYEFNVEAGVALLEEVGWVDNDSNPSTSRVAQGVKGVTNGTSLTITYETTDSPVRQQVAAILKQSLAECGIQANVTLYPASEWFTDGPDGKLFGRRFDLGEFAWLTSAEPPCDLFTSNNVPGPNGSTWISVMDPTAGPQPFLVSWGGQNPTGFFFPAYDSACNKALSSIPGEAQYESSHKEAQRIFAEQLPIIPLYLSMKFAASRPELSGFIMDPTASSEFWNVEAFGITP